MSPRIATKYKNPTLILSVIAVTVCAVRFLLDGITFTAFGSPITLGHIDSFAYSSFLTPILGAHGYIQAKLGITPERPDNADQV